MKGALSGMVKLFFSSKYFAYRAALVFLLVFALLFELIPAPLMADCGKAVASAITSTIDTSTGQSTPSTPTADQTTTVQPTTIQATTSPQPVTANPQPESSKTCAKEVIGKRTANTKTFDNSDGTHTLQIYQEPVHYKENGAYKEIDSNIKLSSTGGFENTAGPFKARFGEKANSDELTSLEFGGVKASFSLADAATAGTTPTVEGSKITYKNILPDTDLREIIVRGGVKEDIILNKYTGKNTFTFELKTAGVTAKKEARFL